MLLPLTRALTLDILLFMAWLCWAQHGHAILIPTNRRVLQDYFAIVAGLIRFWRKDVLHDIMRACIIMHNMIIEDEHDLNAIITVAMEVLIPEVEMLEDDNTRFQEFLARHRQIKNKNAHIAVRNALIDHLWEKYTNSKA